MASRIITKKGSGAPLASDLVHGELAVDTVNKRLYTENAGGTIIELGTAPSTIDINAGTIDGTVIGGSSAAAGTFTSITGTSANINGTVTADGLTVDGNPSVSGTVGVTLDGGTLSTGKDSTSTRTHLAFYNPTGIVGQVDTNSDDLLIGSEGDTRLRTNSLNRIEISSIGDISFYEDTGTTAKFFWDASAESLGIGTTSPSSTYGLDLTKGIRISSVLPNVTLEESDASNHVWQLGSYGGNFSIRDVTHGSYPFTVADGGNVGIGTTSPSYALHVNSGNINVAALLESTDSNVYLNFKDNNTVNDAQIGAIGDNLVMRTNIAERMRIDSSGNVGIGTSSPSYNLVVSAGGASGIEFGPAYSGTANLVQHYSRSGGVHVDVVNDAAQHRFRIGGSEKARIDSSGNWLVGTTAVGASNNNGFTAEPYAGGMVINVGHNGSAANGDGYVFFRRNGTALGSITQVSSTGVSYNITSDERLKENIVDTTHTVDINDIKVRQYDWKSNGEHQRYGFIAQELEAVYPEAVFSPEDPEEMKAVDYSKLVPLLVKEIQDLKAEVAALKGA